MLARMTRGNARSFMTPVTSGVSGISIAEADWKSTKRSREHTMVEWEKTQDRPVIRRGCRKKLKALRYNVLMRDHDL
jgi:hypothetical protein